MAIVKKKGTYYVRLGGKDFSGKQLQGAPFRGPRAARAAEARLKTKMMEGTHVEPSTLTVGTYLEGWLEARKTQVRPSTWDSYRRNIVNHVVPTVGTIPLQRLTGADLDRLYSRLQSQARPLSARTTRYISVILSKSLKDAARKRLVVRNVAQEADPPAAKSTAPSAPKAWNAQEVRTFLEGTSSSRLYPLWHFLAATGARRGEALGLRWTDVDLAAGTVSIRRALTAVGYEIVWTQPKTRRSRRMIDLDPQTVAVLREWRKRQAEERLAVGPDYQNGGLVFAQPDGRPLHPDEVSKRFRREVKAAGLPPLSIHSLRHAHASVGLAAGVPLKIMSERLGHSNIGITADTYSHVLPGLGREAAGQIADVIFGAQA